MKLANDRVFQNAKWIVVCKAIQSLVQLLIGMLSARYLGPKNYGLINYAASVVAFAIPIMQLGMSETLVQEYVLRPNRKGEVLGTTLVMNLVSSAACMIGVGAFVTAANPGQKETIIICVLYSITLVFQALEMMKYWFQSELKSKYSSLATLVAYIVVSVYKTYLLISGKSVYWFALSHAVEYGATAVLLLLAYKNVGGQKIAFSVSLVKEMFFRSRYYVMANLMVTVFQNVGPVVLKTIAGEEANGYYSAAVTCGTVVSFVYMAVIDSVRPVILESKQTSQEVFERNVSRLYSGVIYCTLAQSVLFALFAKPIVLLLYGKAFMPAIRILQIIVWQLAFSFVGTIRNIWILGEEKHRYLWIINLGGAVASIGLNLLLIPVWGACGAAVASVATQIFTNVVMGFILKPIRRNNVLLLRGMNPKLLVEMASMILKK